MFNKYKYSNKLDFYIVNLLHMSRFFVIIRPGWPNLLIIFIISRAANGPAVIGPAVPLHAFLAAESIYVILCWRLGDHYCLHIHDQLWKWKQYIHEKQSPHSHMKDRTSEYVYVTMYIKNSLLGNKILFFGIVELWFLWHKKWYMADAKVSDLLAHNKIQKILSRV
jgi:hypothetical protein